MVVEDTWFNMEVSDYSALSLSELPGLVEQGLDESFKLWVTVDSGWSTVEDGPKFITAAINFDGRDQTSLTKDDCRLVMGVLSRLFLLYRDRLTDYDTDVVESTANG